MFRNRIGLANYLIVMSFVTVAFELGRRGTTEMVALIILIPLYGVWAGFVSRRR